MNDNLLQIPEMFDPVGKHMLRQRIERTLPEMSGHSHSASSPFDVFPHLLNI